MPALTRTELLAAAKAFCDSFMQGKPLDEILSHFASTSESGGEVIVVHEHGVPQLAPFIGRDFVGLDGAREYFETVGSLLKFEGLRFTEFVVDAEGGGDEGGKVAARGKAGITWNETGQSWDETFVYVLRFDEGGKVVRWDVWADSGAAYLARRGEL